MQPKPKFRVLLGIRCRSVDTTGMMLGIAKYQQEHGQWSVFVDDAAGSERPSEKLWGEEWAGVLCGEVTPIMAQTCAERRVPLVSLGDGPHFPGIPQVRPHNTAVGHMAAEDLSERGFRHFAFVGFSDQAWSRERRDGFVEGLGLLGLGCDVLEAPRPPFNSPDWEATQVRRIAGWLQRQPRPLGLLACHDDYALVVLEAARQAGLSVPEDLAVLGVNDDRAGCEMSRPMLSSVALNFAETGYLAAGKLAALMAGGAPAENTLVEPMGIMTRQSTDILAIADRRISMALSFIRENACRKLKVEEVTKRAGVARHDLERGFRKYVGRSPQEEIRRIRLAEIRRLLQYTDRSLSEIAEITGFEHVEYMCVLFKRLTGKTPGSFRREVRGGQGMAIPGGLPGMAVFSPEPPPGRRKALALAAV